MLRRCELVVCREPKEDDNEEEDLSRPPRIEMAATARVGELKDKLNVKVGKRLGLDDVETSEMSRMALTTGRKVWSDVETLRGVVEATGGVASLTYGTILVDIASADLRDPPSRSLEEEAELERVRIVRENTLERRQRGGSTGKSRRHRGKLYSSATATAVSTR